MNISVIRPGILVGLHCSIEGGRKYVTEEQHEEIDGVRQVADWKTTRTVSNIEEWKLAETARTLCRKLIEQVCIRTEFGLICIQDREAELWQAMANAKATAEEFNLAAEYSTVRVRILPARVAENETEAARAIAGELAGLIGRMEDGIGRADAEIIRDACLRAKRLGTMLTEDQGKKVNVAIEAARKAARDIVRRVTRSGELAETVIAELGAEKSAVESARFAFLDLEEQLGSVQSPELPAIDLSRFAEVGEESKA